MTKQALTFLALLLVILCVLRIAFSHPVSFPREEFVKFEATVTGDIRREENSQVIELADVRVYAPKYPEYQIGDRLRIEGTVNENGNMFSPVVTKVGERFVLLAPISALRAKIAANISQIMSAREATLVMGTVLGLDTISPQFKEALIKTGTIHVVVVSGQNLMIVVGFVMAFAGYLGRRKTLALSLILVIFYSLLAGLQPPVLRAVIVVTLSTVAIYMGRQVNVLWSLFVAAVLIVLVWPQAIFEISFQLTFAASLGILTLGQKLIRLFKRVPVLGEGAAVSVSAFLFTMPVIAFYFGRVSLLSPVVNILVAEAVLPIMLLGFFISITSLIYLPLAKLIAILALPFAIYFSEVVYFFARLNIGQIAVR